MELIAISKVKPSKRNPRKIKALSLDTLVLSLLNFPQMLTKRPTVIGQDNCIIGGDQRYRAFKRILNLSESDFNSKLISVFGSANNQRYNKSLELWSLWRAQKVIPCEIATDWTDEEMREFTIKDNSHFGDWDEEVLLDEFADLPLEEWGLDELDIFKGNALEETEEELNGWMNAPIVTAQPQPKQTINRGEFDPSYSAVNSNVNNESTYLTINCSQDSKTRWRKLLKSRDGISEDELFKELLNAVS